MAMNLPPKAIKEFKDIFLNQFGIELTDKEANRKAKNVLDVFSILFKENHSRTDINKSSPIDKNDLNSKITRLNNKFVS